MDWNPFFFTASRLWCSAVLEFCKLLLFATKFREFFGEFPYFQKLVFLLFHMLWKMSSEKWSNMFQFGQKLERWKSLSLVVLAEWFKGVGTMKTYLIICLISTTLLFQAILGQKLLDGLRNIIKALDGGETDSESGIDINVLRKLPIPPDFIPEEFKAIKKRMCNNQPPKRCLCEDGAKLKEINIDPNNDGKHATLEDILKIYSSCRPM